MIIPKIKCNFLQLFMAVIIDHFQIYNSILLACLNWPSMIVAKVVRDKFDQEGFIFDDVELQR